MVGPAIGDRIHGQPLLRCTGTTGHTYPDHEAVIGFQHLLAPLITYIAVILLVDPVKFCQLCIRLTESSARGVRQTLLQRAAQKVAVGLDVFNRVGTGGISSHDLFPQNP